MKFIKSYVLIYELLDQPTSLANEEGLFILQG